MLFTHKIAKINPPTKRTVWIKKEMFNPNTSILLEVDATDAIDTRAVEPKVPNICRNEAIIALPWEISAPFNPPTQ